MMVWMRYAEVLERLLEPECDRSAARCAVSLLAECGLLDESRCRALAIAVRVAGKVAEGVPKTEAMEAAAEEFCCSYQTVCRSVYDRQILKTIEKIKS